MNTKYITMIMPTYNHPAYIDYFLKNSVSNYNGAIFKFEIHDSSLNNQTKELIDAFNKNHANKIDYFRYDSTINGDAKTYKALCNCKTEHIYLMGDGICPDFNKLEQYLILNNYHLFDLLGIQPNWFIKRFRKMHLKLDIVYDNFDVGEFFNLFYHEFTFYGGSIISKKIWDYIVANSLFDKFKYKDKYSFAYDLSVFESLPKNDFKYGMSFISFYKGNPLKKQASWNCGELYYEIALCELEHDIQILSEYYDPYKKQAIKKNRKVFWNFKTLFIQKSRKNINFKLLKKYKKDLLRYKPTYRNMLFLCFVPTFIIRMSYCTAKSCKRLVKIMLGRK